MAEAEAVREYSSDGGEDTYSEMWECSGGGALSGEDITMNTLYAQGLQPRRRTAGLTTIKVVTKVTTSEAYFPKKGVGMGVKDNGRGWIRRIVRAAVKEVLKFNLQTSSHRGAALAYTRMSSHYTLLPAMS